MSDFGIKAYDENNNVVIDSGNKLSVFYYTYFFEGVDLDLTVNLSGELPSNIAGLDVTYTPIIVIETMEFRSSNDVGVPAYRTPLLFSFTHPHLRLRWKFIPRDPSEDFYIGKVPYYMKGFIGFASL